MNKGVTLDMYKGMHIEKGFEKAWSELARKAAVLARSAMRHSQQANETKTADWHNKAAQMHHEAANAFKTAGDKENEKKHRDLAVAHGEHASNIADKKKKPISSDKPSTWVRG